MNIEYINVGTANDAGDGDPIRDAFIKCNNNFGLISDDIVNNTQFTGSVRSVDGKLLVDGINGWIPYTPATPSDWPTVPLNMTEAIDNIAKMFAASNIEKQEQLQVFDVEYEQQRLIAFPNNFIGDVYTPHNLTIFHNGSRLLHGDNRDYTIFGLNAIKLNQKVYRTVDVGDTITALAKNFPITYEYDQ